MSHYKPPNSFDVSSPSGWKAWRSAFMAFRKLTKLDKEPADMQVCSLQYVMGMPASENIYDQFANSLPSPVTFDAVIGAYDQYFIPKKNLVHLRAQFDKRVQRPEESIEQFIRVLHILAKDCEFSAEEERVQDRFVVGLLDEDISDKLQMESCLTLSKAVDIARQIEQVKIQKKERTSQANVDATFKSKPPSGQKKFHARGQKCDYCGFDRHEQKFQCPAFGKKCRNCDGKNHFAKVCRKKAAVRQVTVDFDETPRSFIGAVSNESSDWTVKVNIRGTTVNCKVDTGADVDIITESTMRSIKDKPQLYASSTELVSPGGKVKCVGCFDTKLYYKDQTVDATVYVVRGDHVANLLSRDTAVKMGIVNFVATVDSAIFGEIGSWKMKPVKIRLNHGAQPYSVTAARRVPFPLMEPVKTELNRMEKSGVITRITDPTDWCAPMVPVIKKTENGKPTSVRICVDLKRLNQQVKREKYFLPVFEELAARLADSTVFSKLDAASGFWQIPLANESKRLTTFITPFGRFHFNRLCFGINIAPEIYQRKMSELLAGIENVVVYMDDILCYGKTAKEHDEALQQVVHRIKEAGIKLNESKCEFNKTDVKFLGYVLSRRGIEVDPGKVSAIKEMEAPKDITELKRFLGLVNFLRRHLPQMSYVAKPLTDLLRKDICWSWSPVHQKAFEEVKTVVTKAPVLAYYNANSPVVVASDASAYGMGGVIMQEKDGHLHPVAYCSRTLSECESRYAVIEKELLSCVYTCEQFNKYLFGLPSFILRTDHRPLVPLINSTRLDESPLRCQRLLMRLMRYNVKAEYIPGAKQTIPDLLSRAPTNSQMDQSSKEVNDEIKLMVAVVTANLPASPMQTNRLKEELQEDSALSLVYKYTVEGWPTDVPEHIQDYASAQQHLSVLDGLLLYHHRLVIPRSQRQEMLEKIHSGHMGFEKCRIRARESIWWPGIAKDIKSHIEGCTFCLENAPQQHREPLIQTALPNGPWEEVAADIFELEGRHYIVLCDYYSRYLEIKALPSLTSVATIERIKSVFAQHGIPSKLRTDCGSQFISQDFSRFAKEYDFELVTSSPRYPQSNGEAERAVQTAKRILRQKDPHLALMSYRCTPTHMTGISPGELLFNRKIRTNLPQIRHPVNRSQHTRVKKKNDKKKEEQASCYNKRNGVRKLPELPVGATVFHNGQYFQIENQNGIRSYRISNDHSTLVRNRYQLRGPVQQGSTTLPFGHGTTQQQGRTENLQEEATASGGAPIPSAAPNCDRSPATRVTRSGRLIKPPARLDL